MQIRTRSMGNGDHNGKLPGPCYGLVPAKPAKNQLLYYLLPYMGSGSKSGVAPADSYICKGWKSKTPDPSGAVYALRVSIAPPGGNGSWIWPFGYPDKYEPLTYAGMSAFYAPSEVAVLTDCDQQYLEGIGVSASAASVPWRPVHRNHRNVLYLDGHVLASEGTAAPWP